MYTFKEEENLHSHVCPTPGVLSALRVYTEPSGSARGLQKRGRLSLTCVSRGPLRPCQHVHLHIPSAGPFLAHHLHAVFSLPPVLIFLPCG